MRQVWLRFHRYIGLTVALFLLLAGLTGSIIAYQQELDAWLNPDLFYSAGQGHPLSPEALIDHLEHHLPAYRIVSLPLTSEAGKAVRISVRPRFEYPDKSTDADELFVDPVNGNLLGSRVWGACCFERKQLIPFLYVLHYSLQLPGDSGLWVMGVVAIAWLFESLLGLYLSLPKRVAQTDIPSDPTKNFNNNQRTWLQRWAIAWRIKPHAGTRRLSFDLHRAGGLWFIGLMLMLAVSAISLNLRDAVFEPVVSVFSDFTPSVFDAREQRSEQPPVEASLSFADILQQAYNEVVKRGWQKLPYSIFYNPGFGIYGVGYGDPQGLGLWYLYFDSTTGKLLGDYVPGTGTAADIFEAWQLPLHSGQLIGLPGRILISLTGIIVVILLCTGLLVWLNKRKAQQLKRSKQSRACNRSL